MKVTVTSSALFALALAGTQSAAAQATACSLSGLGWTAGSWASAKDPKGPPRLALPPRKSQVIGVSTAYGVGP